MKNKVWLVLSLVAVVITASLFCIGTSAATSGYYTYKVSGSTATITDVNTNIMGTVSIPSTLGGYPVTAIGNNAFEGCEYITTLTIPSGVKSVGNYAFAGCGTMTKITLPSTVQSIGTSAFAGCSSLSSVSIPNSVKTLGAGAFENCKALRTVTLGTGITKIAEGTFSSCPSLASITVPAGVVSIGEGAFAGCSSMLSVTLADSTKVFLFAIRIPPLVSLVWLSQHYHTVRT